MTKMLVVIFLSITTLFTLFMTAIYDLTVFYFYALIFFLIINYIKVKQLNLLHVWLAGFIFIILSEGLLNYAGLRNAQYGLLAMKILILANNLVIAGYFLSSFKTPFLFAEKKNITVKSGSLFWIVLFSFLFIFLKLPKALATLRVGRTGVSEVIDIGAGQAIFDNVTTSLGLILPAIIAFYFRFFRREKSILWPFSLVFPILLTLFLTGTRFPLLFSFLGFVLMYKTRNKSNVSFLRKNYLFISLVVLFLLSVSMKSFRTFGLSNKEIDFFKLENNEKASIPTQLARNMSPEGVVDMTALMIDYFGKHEHLYGKSTSFLFYFWIPRFIWEEKPTMVGHWFIREYRSGFSSGHSTSFGFSGDFYADFGIYGVLLVFLIGIFIRKAENFKSTYINSIRYERVLAAMLFPYIFFMVRSPITATINFLGILFFYFLLRFLLFRKV